MGSTRRDLKTIGGNKKIIDGRGDAKTGRIEKANGNESS